MRSRRRIITLAIAAVIAGFACSVAQAANPREFTTIEGRFDVGGHKLYLRCEGSGPGPTVVYFHGSIENGQGGAISAAGIPLIVREKRRICVYDRANLGDSDKVKGPITGKQIVADLHALLRAAGVKPPYVLLGASFGVCWPTTTPRPIPSRSRAYCCSTPAFPASSPSIRCIRPPTATRTTTGTMGPRRSTSSTSTSWVSSSRSGDGCASR